MCGTSHMSGQAAESNTTCLEPVFFRGSQPGRYVNRKHAAGRMEALERRCGTNWNN